MSEQTLDSVLDILKARRWDPAAGKFHQPRSRDFAAFDKDAGTATFCDSKSDVIKTDDKDMSADFLISTPSGDRMGDVIQPRGCLGHLDHYKNNAQVFFNHKSFELPIGLSTRPGSDDLCVSVSDQGIWATCFFHGRTPESTQVYELVKHRILKAASIGFRPLKGRLIQSESSKSKDRDVIEFDKFWPGIEFEEWELLEWSVVGIPCNQDAVRSFLSRGKIAGEKIAEPIHKMLSENLVPESKVTLALTDLTMPTGDIILFAEDVGKIGEVGEIGHRGPEAMPDGLDVPKIDLVVEEEILIVDSYKPVEYPKLYVSMDEYQELEKKYIGTIKALETAVPAVSKEGKVIEPSVPAADPDPEVEAQPDPTPASKKRKEPAGVAALKFLIHELGEIDEALTSRLDLIEHAKTAPFLEGVNSQVCAMCKDAWKFARKTYPDHFPAEESASSEMQESAPEKSVKYVEPIIEKTLETVPDTTPEPDYTSLSNALDALSAQNSRIGDAIYHLTGKRP